MATKKQVQATPKTRSTRQLRVKEESLDESFAPEGISKFELEKHSKQFFIIIIAATTFISSLITFGIAKQFSPGMTERTTLAAQTSGGVCLSEKELKSIVSKNKIVAYWTGPMSKATYSINSTTAGQVFIRYIPSGKDCGSTAAEFRVIATYSDSEAFSSTQLAGSQAEGVSLTNVDGSVVYFNKSAPRNVYLAYPGINYQIEVFDPDPKTAVTLATKSNSIELIRG